VTRRPNRRYSGYPGAWTIPKEYAADVNIALSNELIDLDNVEM